MLHHKERPKPTPRLSIKTPTQADYVTLEYVEKINETLELLLKVDEAMSSTLPDNDIKKAICALVKIQTVLFSQTGTSRLTVKETGTALAS